MIIKLNDFEKIKQFANKVCAFEPPVQIGKVDSESVYNAKSILSLFAMDLSSPLNVRIVTADEKLVEVFNREMGAFVD
jgi:hypothetical protein